MPTPEKPEMRVLQVATLATVIATGVNISLILYAASAAWIVTLLASGLDMPIPVSTWLWACVILISPVTLFLLPAGTLLGARHWSIRLVWYSFLGLAGGAISAKLWAIARDGKYEIIGLAKNYLFFELPSYGGHYFIFANTVAGLAGGIVFASSMRTAPTPPIYDRVQK